MEINFKQKSESFWEFFILLLHEGIAETKQKQSNYGISYAVQK